MFLHPLGIQGTDPYRNNDWLSILALARWVHVAVHDLGQFPLWCPHLGGGYPTIQHPSDLSLTPLALPVVLFGEVIGVKVDLAILVFLGGLGMLLLAREALDLGTWGATFAAVAFQCSAWLPSMMLVGFFNLAVYQLIPLILYFLLRARSQLRLCIPAGILLGFVIYLGVMGTVVVTGFAALLTLALVLGGSPGGRRPDPRPLAALVAALLIATGVGAVRLVGVSDLTARGFYLHGWIADSVPEGDSVWDFHDPREQPEYDEKDFSDAFYTDLGHFAKGLTWHVPLATAADGTGQPADDEYAYLGIPWAALILFVVALPLLRLRALPWIGPAAVFAVLCFGPNSPLDLYEALVWWIPLLQTISQFYKYANFFLLLVIVLLSGAAVDWLRAHPRLGRAAPWVAAGAIASSLPFLALHGTLTAERFKVAVDELPREDSFHQVRSSSDASGGADAFLERELSRPPTLTEYHNLGRNVGTIDWYADIYLPENSVAARFVDPITGAEEDNPRYQGEAWLVEGGGEVRAVQVRANTIAVSVSIEDAGTLVVNQNHDRRWRCNSAAIDARAGLMAIRLDPGEHDLRLRFVPTDLYVGMATSAVTLVGCAVVWIAPWRRRRSR